MEKNKIELGSIVRLKEQGISCLCKDCLLIVTQLTLGNDNVIVYCDTKNTYYDIDIKYLELINANEDK